VLAKSLHLLALGWVVSVVWLWGAQVEMNLRRFGVAPEGYGFSILIEGTFPAALVELLAVLLAGFIAKYPGTGEPRREWWHAFWWTLTPNLLLFVTVFLLTRGTRP
jgi:hypothetical protein